MTDIERKWIQMVSTAEERTNLGTNTMHDDAILSVDKELKERREDEETFRNTWELMIWASLDGRFYAGKVDSDERQLGPFSTLHSAILAARGGK